jgi:starvation-inducible DNA-binding protein
MKPNIGLADKGRKEVARLLNILLADEVALYLKTRNFHWNVTGPNFHDLHKFFESQYEALDEILDDVAERVRSLGFPAFGSLQEFAKHTRNKEQAGAELGARAMVGQLLADHEAVVRRLRVDAETAGKFGDAGTNDFLVGLIEEHEKMAWMLRATVTV